MLALLAFGVCRLVWLPQAVWATLSACDTAGIMFLVTLLLLQISSVIQFKSMVSGIEGASDGLAGLVCTFDEIIHQKIEEENKEEEEEEE